ncbi:MAG: class II fructose-bisphosphate aldolase [Candidatus Portnoybacteria bacterium]|nr:class II fructose-bisphosphate aldolase [Candidatus Portnoybacteria bacterium]MDD4982943.1 class II fructose-bisphosphate aldolase [Candidatus Portnoybacteria bacterium]
MKEILKKAQQGKYAVGSFNFSTAEILKAIVAAAQELKSPIIVSTSEGEAGFIGMREAAALVEAWREATKLPIILNLDHGKSLEIIKKVVAAGYNAVHFDGSSLPYEKNLAQTNEVVKYIRQVEKTFDREIIVEGELGYLRGASSLHKEKLEIKESDLTSPEQALDFIERTGVDSLAVVIGNAHGVFAAGEEKLHLKRLAEIKEAIGDKAFLVLHGGSGIPAEDVKKAIEMGIAKVNINTELRLAYKAGLDKELAEKPDETTPYKILEHSFEEVKKVVAEKIRMFGSAGKA